MKYLITILIFIPLSVFAQQKCNNIYTRFYVSTPLITAFICDTVKCEGYCKSFYKNGNPHIIGKFEDGQPIDTLLTYDSSGFLEEMFIPESKGLQRIKYYYNGQIKSKIDGLNRKRTEYYLSGQLKTDHSWDPRKRSTIKSYNETGNLILTENHKIQKKFYPDGSLKSTITRKEVLIVKRLFSKHLGRLYKYNWIKYDSSANIKWKILFLESGFSGNQYPNNYTEVTDDDFLEIVLYEDNIPLKRIDFKWIKEGNEFIKYLVLYGMIKGEWIKEKETTANNIYEIIATLGG